MPDRYAAGDERSEAKRRRDRWAGFVIAILIGAGTLSLCLGDGLSAWLSTTLGAVMLALFLTSILLATSSDPGRHEAYGCLGCFFG